jgi:hypothetical protein
VDRLQLAQQFVIDRFHQGLASTWSWFNTLNREEWLLVLGAGCVLGFFCMRGWGSRRQF